MRSITKVVIALLIGLLGGLIPVASASASTPSPAQLGGLDLGAYCRAIGWADAALTGPTAYDWHCVANDGRRGDLTFDAACRWTYSTGDAVDRIGDFRDPASVTCFRVTPTVTTPDFEHYCTATGHSAAVLLGASVYDWRCVSYSRAGPTYYNVYVRAVCQWTTAQTAAIDRFVNYSNARSWQCRV
ncbi:hypothetical protein [Krasilnikovia sp. MM14-A1004]|uniref:hypothetical protein n=1 Tax=Krasilnikovia sp. MM14-A1004 TaxID=3373541 RepID=UPI00399D518D